MTNTPVKDFSGQLGGHGMPEYAEHEVDARAKRVMTVTTFQLAPDGASCVAPITGVVAASSASITIAPQTLYRVASNTDCYIRLSIGASTAVDTDFALPAFSPIYIKNTVFDTLSFIEDSADGIIQAFEVV